MQAGVVTNCKSNSGASREAIPQDVARKLQFAAFAGNAHASSFLEMRTFRPDMTPGPREWFPVREYEAAAARAGELSDRFNEYVAVAPRTRQAGTADAIEGVWVLHVDLDGQEALELERAQRFRPPPSIVVLTGSEHHAHAYWPLSKPIAPAWAQRANRRLAIALAGDLGSTDPARILRPAGTLNHKHHPPQPVICTRLELDVFTPDQVVQGLADDREYRPRPITRHPAARSTTRRLDRVANKVLTATNGERNRLLNWAAFTLAPAVAAGELDDGQVRNELTQAALAAGLTEAETLRTINSGLTAGAA